MKIETLRNVLHWNHEFHRHLSLCLSHWARMILLYLSDHEKVLAKVLNRFEASDEGAALNTWCNEYISLHPIIQHEKCDDPFSALDPEQVMDVIVDQHQQVMKLYRFLASRARARTGSELLELIETLEEHEVIRMVQSANRYRNI